MRNIQNKKVIILGLGVSGLAMAHWCYRHGAEFTVVDTRAKPPQYDIFKNNFPSAKFICSEFESELILNNSYELMLVSPGIRPKDIEAISAVAINNNVTIADVNNIFRCMNGIKSSSIV